MIAYLTTITAAGLKFFIGIATGQALGLAWYETTLCTTAGMLLAVLGFRFLGESLLRYWYKKRPPRRFSKRTRIAVKVYRRFGVAGLAALTPIILMPIGGGLLAASFKIKTIPLITWMTASGLFWGSIASFGAEKVMSFLR